MGLVLYPYQTIQALLWAEEVIKGYRRDPHNLFRWDEVRLNFPGDTSYTPALPWVSKVRGPDKVLATNFVDYVDDFRVSGEG